MSLIMCKCCRKEISVNAEKCPFCGEPMKLTEEQKKKAIKENENNKKIFYTIMVILVILVIVAFNAIYDWIDKKSTKWPEDTLEFIFDTNIEM